MGGRIFCCMLYLSLVLVSVQGNSDLDSLKRRIFEILRKEKYETETDQRESVQQNLAPISNRGFANDNRDEENKEVQKKDWINYAKEEELLSFMETTQKKIAELEKQLNQDYCEDSPCLNYGECVNRLHGYECRCKPGFVGPECQIETGAQTSGKVLSVTNGGLEGDWYDMEMCPAASFATDFRIKLESDQGAFGDDSAMNAIEIQCKNVVTGEVTANISSGEGVFGDWRSWQSCPEDYLLVSFQMKVEKDQGSSDDSSVNGVTMACRGPGFTGEEIQEMTGPVGSEGTWGSMSDQCPPGQAICGLATRVESPQGAGDDSGLNDIQFKCCYWW